MPYEWTSRIPQFRKMVDNAAFEATSEVFEFDMLRDAKQDSPVLTGTNRRSLDIEVHHTQRGPEATMFSQSGYGGYLELGTARMKAQPYLFPAFRKNVKKILTVFKEKLRR